MRNKIPVHVTNRFYSKCQSIPNDSTLHQQLYDNLKTIRRSNKVVQALELPTVININPRSLNNKIEAFKTYMEEEEVDLAFISESHEQLDKTLVDNLHMENYQVISNVHQRRGKGGRPALVVRSDKFQIQNVTNTLINIPWGVEAVWAVLTPNNVTNDSKIQHLAVCSFYNRNKRSKFKTTLLNHITEAINILSRKYTKGLHFILGADANHLKLDSILSLRQDMRSVVEDYTRLGPPPAMLDPIITTLGNYYQSPVCYPPLEADLGTGGAPSDHLIVKMMPINMINNKAARTFSKVTVRPMPMSAMLKYNMEMKSHDWESVYSATSAHEKAFNFQAESVKIVEKCFPSKKIKVSSDDRPWWNPQLQNLHRRKQRVYRSERKSLKWSCLENKFKTMMKLAKKNFYAKMINELVEKDQNQWYSQFKRLTNQGKLETVVVEKISHLSD